MSAQPLRFRVWDSKRKKFFHWGFTDGIFVGPPSGDGLTLAECAQSDRFMGIQDRDGNDIYENDIVQIVYKLEMEPHPEGGHTRHVMLKWHDHLGKWLWVAVDGRRGGPWLFTTFRSKRTFEKFHVIGSVQATPELIQAGKVTARLTKKNEYFDIDDVDSNG